jgi:hypothetical protein
MKICSDATARFMVTALEFGVPVDVVSDIVFCANVANKYAVEFAKERLDKLERDGYDICYGSYKSSLDDIVEEVNAMVDESLGFVEEVATA